MKRWTWLLLALLPTFCAAQVKIAGNTIIQGGPSGAGCPTTGCTYAGPVVGPSFTGPLTGNVTGHAPPDLPAAGGTTSGNVDRSTDSLPRGWLSINAFGGCAGRTAADDVNLQALVTYAAAHPQYHTGYLGNDHCSITRPVHMNGLSGFSWACDPSQTNGSPSCVLLDNEGVAGGKRGVLLDFAQCGYCGQYWVSELPGTSPGAYGGTLVTNGSGPSVSALSFMLYQSTISVGSQAGFMCLDADLCKDEDSYVTTGVVMGLNQGLATSVNSLASPWKNNYNSTKMTINGGQVAGQSGVPALQLTGSQDYYLDGPYIANFGTGYANGGIIVSAPRGFGPRNALHGGFRLEDQSRDASTTPGMYLKTGIAGGTLAASFASKGPVLQSSGVPGTAIQDVNWNLIGPITGTLFGSRASPMRVNILSSYIQSLVESTGRITGYLDNVSLRLQTSSTAAAEAALISGAGINSCIYTQAGAGGKYCWGGNSGTQVLSGVQGTTGPNLFAAKGSFVSGNLVATDSHGNAVDSGVAASAIRAPSSTVTTTAAVTVTNNNGNYFNQEARAATAVTYRLPAPTRTSQLCFRNSNNGSAANTGTLELLVANTGTQSIDYNGTKTSRGYVISGGAAGDGGCLVGISSTMWELYSSGSTSWTVH
ncbi:MAG: hypothetical protein WBW84_13330 [Acidobacteriaceae bacterium]